MKYLSEIKKIVNLTFHICKEHLYPFYHLFLMKTRFDSTTVWQRLTRCSNALPFPGDMDKQYLLVLTMGRA